VLSVFVLAVFARSKLFVADYWLLSRSASIPAHSVWRCVNRGTVYFQAPHYILEFVPVSCLCAPLCAVCYVLFCSFFLPLWFYRAGASHGTIVTTATAIVRQGRCTLVTTIQMYRILAVHCLVLSYMLSALYSNGVKSGDTYVGR